MNREKLILGVALIIYSLLFLSVSLVSAIGRTNNSPSMLPQTVVSIVLTILMIGTAIFLFKDKNNSEQQDEQNL